MSWSTVTVPMTASSSTSGTTFAVNHAQRPGAISTVNRKSRTCCRVASATATGSSLSATRVRSALRIGQRATRDANGTPMTLSHAKRRTPAGLAYVMTPSASVTITGSVRWEKAASSVVRVIGVYFGGAIPYALILRYR